MTLSPGAKVQLNFSTLRSPAGFKAACSSMLSERAPTPPRFIGHRTWISRIEAEATRDASFYQLHDAGNCSFGIICLNKIEVAFALWSTQIGKDTLVDAVSVHDDLALGRLAKHLGQAHHRNGPTRNHVGEHLAGADRWQLIDIPNNQQSRRVRHRLEQCMHQ